jgi:hypothetical protein
LSVSNAVVSTKHSNEQKIPCTAFIRYKGLAQKSKMTRICTGYIEQRHRYRYYRSDSVVAAKYPCIRQAVLRG